MVIFIGTVHELKPDCVEDTKDHPASEHIAPSLMMSGTFGKPTRRIQDSFEKRYYMRKYPRLLQCGRKVAFWSGSHSADNKKILRE